MVLDRQRRTRAPLVPLRHCYTRPIYEQAKQIGKLNEAVDYLKSMKSVPPSVAEAALAETAQRGFGSTQNAMMTPPTDFPPIWANGEAWVPVQDGPHVLPPGPPSPLQRSAAEQLPDITPPADSQFQTPPRNRPEPLESPPALIRQRTVRFRDDEAKNNVSQPVRLFNPRKLLRRTRRAVRCKSIQKNHKKS